MIFCFFNIFKTALNMAIKNDNVEITKLLLSSKNIDVNIKELQYMLYDHKGNFYINFNSLKKYIKL